MGHKPSPAAVSFVKKLLERVVSHRPTADMALQLTFIREQGKDIADAKKEECSASLKEAIQKARQRTQELDVPVDPTTQRAIDEILEKLRLTRSESKVRSTAPGKTMVRHFSFSDSFVGPIGNLDSFR